MNLIAVLITIVFININHGFAENPPQLGLSIPPIAANLISTTDLNKIHLPKTEQAAQKWWEDFTHLRRPEQRDVYLANLKEGREGAQKIISSIQSELKMLSNYKRQAEALQKKLAAKTRRLATDDQGEDKISEQREELQQIGKRIVQMNQQIDNGIARVRKVKKAIQFTDQFLKWNRTLREGLVMGNAGPDLNHIRAALEELQQSRMLSESILNDFKMVRMQGDVDRLGTRLLENQMNQEIHNARWDRYIQQWSVQLLKESCDNVPQCARGGQVVDGQRKIQSIKDRLHETPSKDRTLSR